MMISNIYFGYNQIINYIYRNTFLKNKKLNKM